MKHTPGPWHIVDPEFGRRGYIHGNTDTEYSYYVCELFTKEGNNMANARLIAAAPDLLAMLERVTAELYEGQTLTDARALIAKIKGE